MASAAANSANIDKGLRKQQKTRDFQSLENPLSALVAEAGFEPTTFGL